MTAATILDPVSSQTACEAKERRSFLYDGLITGFAQASAVPMQPLLALARTEKALVFVLRDWLAAHTALLLGWWLLLWRHTEP